MTSVLGRVAPTRSALFALLLDLGFLAGALAAIAQTPQSESVVELAWLTAAACSTWFVTATALRHYDPSTRRGFLDDFAMTSVLVLAVASELALVRLAAPPTTGLPSVGPFLLVAWPQALLCRLVLERRLFARDAPSAGVLIVGSGQLARVTADDLPRQVIGFLSLPGDQVPQALESRCLGRADELDRILATRAVDEVYLAANGSRDGAVMQASIETCETFGVPFAVPVPGFRLDRSRPVDARAVSDGYLHYLTIEAKPGQRALKRLFDIVVSATALWLLTPLLLAAAAAIRLSSRGPVLFRQERVGLNGRRFRMLKFRTMVLDAEKKKEELAAKNEQSGPVFKIRDDPRIIPVVGRFLRRHSIDELPQLINVLRGEMSVVGPRPPVPGEVQRYQAWQHRRLSVRPGLTCIWQVSGRNQISFEDWMYLDMRYIDHWSLSVDLALILRTLPVVLTGRGAS